MGTLTTRTAQRTGTRRASTPGKGSGRPRGRSGRVVARPARQRCAILGSGVAVLCALAAGLAAWQVTGQPAASAGHQAAASAGHPAAARAAAAQPSGSAQAVLPPQDRNLVLTAAAAGSSYALDGRVSGSRTLAVVSAGDAPQIAAVLKRDWLRGAEVAFEPRESGPTIVSIGDAFRPGSPVGAILAAWRADAIRTLSGTALPLPKGAPGTSPALIRGTFTSYGVLLYMWRTGNTIRSVELIGAPGALHVPFLIHLAANTSNH